MSQVMQLENLLSQSLTEQNLLKAQNTLLSKQLQRLSKKMTSQKDKQGQYNKKLHQIQQQHEEKIKNIQKKYTKHLQMQQDKLRNCHNTILKYEQLYSNLCKESFKNLPTTNRKSQNSQIIKQLICKKCNKKMRPHQYFNHLNEGCEKQKQSSIIIQKKIIRL